MQKCSNQSCFKKNSSLSLRFQILRLILSSPTFELQRMHLGQTVHYEIRGKYNGEYPQI